MTCSVYIYLSVRPPAFVADVCLLFVDEEAMTAAALISGWGMLAPRRVIPFRVIDRELIAPLWSDDKKRAAYTLARNRE